MVNNEHFRKRTCPVCGKEFYCYIDSWAYHRQPNKGEKKYFCSWSCLNKFDAVRIKEWKKRGRKPEAIENERRDYISQEHQAKTS